MSKKSKPKVQSSAPKVRTSPESVVGPTPVSTPPKPKSETTQQAPLVVVRPSESAYLIQFTKPVKWFTGVCVGLFLILTLLKIHGASVAMWNQIIPDGSDPKRGLISGKAKAIRVDEYGVLTPYMLSQAKNGFELRNEVMGDGEVPLVLGVPVKHFITLFRPHFWGFFILDTERGFAWWWNFKVFGILLSAFFLCLVLTRNSFWLSVFGSVWILLSSGTLWWFSTGLTEMIIGACLLPVTVIYLLYGESTRQVLAGALLTTWGSLYFASHLYPPYQVPLAYLMGFLLVGYIVSRKRADLLANLPMKGVGVALALGLIGVLAFLYYRDARPTLDLMLNTAYPGKRIEHGGGGFLSSWFSEYYNSFFINDQHFPKEWLNICELSHYITFAPIILAWIVYQFVTTGKINPVLVGLGAFVLFGWLWIEVGFPDWLGKLTLMNTSPTRRTQIPFGLGNVLLALAFLYDAQRQTVTSSATVRGLVVAGAVALVAYGAYLTNMAAPGFFRGDQLIIGAIYFGILNALILPVWSFSYRTLVVCLGVLGALLPNLSVNPVAKGLTPITENVLYRSIDAIRQQDPDARWVVYGSNFITYLVGATGVKQISGVKYTPNFTIMHAIDPAAKRDTVYNRYAHSVYRAYPNPTDTTVIDNGGSYDAYGVYIDPCSPKLRKLNVKYAVFEKVEQPAETRCMTLLNELGTLKIYRINY